MSLDAATQGIHHVGLTVPDLSETRSFFIDALGYTEVGQMPDYPACFLSDGSTTITLWQAVDPTTTVAFDRKNVIGLHHLALNVAGANALRTLHHQLEKHRDVAVEFSPEPLLDGPAEHMMCTIPGGIRVEFIAA